MALVHAVALRNTLADDVVDAIDAGTTDASGDVKIYAGATLDTNPIDDGTLLVTINLNAPPAFGAASSGQASANGLPKEGTAIAGGTANGFSVNNRDNAEVFHGTVGTSGTDMVLSSTTIAVNDVIRINTFTYEAPA